MVVKRRQLFVAIILPIEVCLAVLTWRDLARRSDDQVRGRKNVWRAVVSIHPGNSVAYWLFGRTSK